LFAYTRREIDAGMKGFFDELKRRNVLRVGAAYLAASWLVVQLMDSLLPIFALSETVGRPIVVALVIGFVPALLITWFFEMTPDGLRYDSEIDHDKAPVQSRSGFDRTVIILLILAVGYFAIDKYTGADGVTQLADETDIGDRSIAVLSFADLSPDKDQEYFSDGLAEELLNLLAKIPSLDVASRTSSFAFKGKKVSIEEIGTQLRVEHVLEGSVRMSGDRIRITAQLIKSDDGYHVWSDTYEREFDDIFEIQDEIAAEVVDALRIRLLDTAPRARTAIPEAYSQYLQARYLHRQYSPESMEKARGLYERVIELDPSYAPAYTDVSSIYMNLAMNNLIQPDEGIAKARRSAQTAIELDPEFASGYSQLAWIAQVYDGDLKSSALFYERAIALDPKNAAVLGNAAVLAEALGQLDTSIALKKNLTIKDPTSSIAFNNLGLAYYYANRLQDAENSFRTTIVLSPNYIGAHYRLGTVLLMRENYAEALDAYEREPDEEYRIKGRALAHFALGNRSEADTALAELIEKFGEQYPTEMAHVYAYRGEIDDAFNWLNVRFETATNEPWGEGRLEPLLANLHNDDRWQAFLVRMKVSDAQLADIEFNVPLPELTE